MARRASPRSKTQPGRGKPNPTATEAAKPQERAKRSRPPGKQGSKGRNRRPTRGKRRTAPSEPNEFGPQRLQKVLAAAGLGSRRECETLITSGRVQVDGQNIIELGTRVDPLEQEIRVDGQALPKSRKVYYLVHKPPGVLSTNRDPAGRPRVVDLVPPGPERVYAVGRLDQSSEGLILVTNDGELANQVTHPRYGVRKTYQVLVAGTPSAESLERLLGGIHLAEGVAKVDRIEIRAEHGKSTMLEIVLSEGRNREIRRLLARVGHKVLRLRRIAVGGLKLKGLKSGEYRRLTRDEVDRLRGEVQTPDPARARRSSGSRSKRSAGAGRRPAGMKKAGAGSRPRSSGYGAIADDA
jgi:23S rRNA pseudouridine2605 synthase